MKRKVTHPNDLVGDLLRLPLAFLEISAGTIEFCGVHIFIKAGLDAKELLVYRELVPRGVVRAGSKGQFVALSVRGGVCCVG